MEGGGEEHSVKRRSGAALKAPEQEPLRCPRCDSTNTKFCYYNNYSLTQPRHFCKSCRRYWTKGGALRNVPIGGGCRKNKKSLKSQNDNNGHLQVGSDEMSRRHPQPKGQFSDVKGLPAAPVTTSILSSSCQMLANIPSLESAVFGLEQFPMAPPASLMPPAAIMMEPLTNLNADLQWRIHHQKLSAILGASNAVSATAYVGRRGQGHADDADKENSSVSSVAKPTVQQQSWPSTITSSQPPMGHDSWHPTVSGEGAAAETASCGWNPLIWPEFHHFTSAGTTML